MGNTNKIFERISNQILTSLKKTFPVACASDEFYYFPHMAGNGWKTNVWDDFSAASVQRIIQEISDSISELNHITILNDEKETQVEKKMLVLFLSNLSEQLGESGLWKKQPSFYLTLMNAGLAQALSYGDREWLQISLRELPAFLEQAINNIEKVPYPWQEISLSMIADCKNFLNSLSSEYRNVDFSLEALKNLEKKIKSLLPETEIYVPPDVLEKIYNNHLATGLKISEILNILKDEADDMCQVMFTEAERILKSPVKTSIKPAALIERVYDNICYHAELGEDSVKMFRNEVDQIRSHLMDTGILDDSLKLSCPVRVKEMPPYFRAIRSASSYSIYPQHPPVEGTFYVLDSSGHGVPSENLTEFRMLTAHETWPGHHLLDSSRLALKNIIRRSLEFPVFYEGWACFAEMMLGFTGYFSSSADKFMLAKRRYWRAIRGQVDIGLQAKKLDLISAPAVLADAGIPFSRAAASAKIYTLNPGYQVCYAVGIRRFLDLYNRYGAGNLKNFVRTVLGNGEILFSDLEEILKEI